jgi:hypothetical protein
MNSPKLKKGARDGFLILIFFILLYPQLLFSAQESPVLLAMEKELSRCYSTLSHQQPAPLYFLNYEITDIVRTTISASYGAIKAEDQDHSRYLDVDVRVGSPQLDNTHEIRGEFDFSRYLQNPVRISLEDDEGTIRERLWLETERRFKEAQERYTKILTNKAVKVVEEDLSQDFSQEKPEGFSGEKAKVLFDSLTWKE